MLAIGKNELGQVLTDTIICPHCQQEHSVELSKTMDGKPGSLSFFKCGDNTYLCGIEGQSIMHKFNKEQADAGE